VEQWKIISEYPNYKVSTLGRIMNKDNKIMKQDNDSRYNMVTLYNKQGHKNVSVHRLVAKAFLNNSDNKLTVDHIDRNRRNNKVDNLRWATKLEQEHNKINPQREIYSIDKEGNKRYFEGVHDCARKLNISASKISACLLGHRKTHKGYRFGVKQ